MRARSPVKHQLLTRSSARDTGAIQSRGTAIHRAEPRAAPAKDATLGKPVHVGSPPRGRPRVRLRRPHPRKRPSTLLGVEGNHRGSSSEPPACTSDSFVSSRRARPTPPLFLVQFHQRLARTKSPFRARRAPGCRAALRRHQIDRVSLVLARRGGESVETSFPVDHASSMPARAAELKRSRYVPLRACTAGARRVAAP